MEVKRKMVNHLKVFFFIDDPKNIVKENSWQWKSGAEGHSYVLRIDDPKKLNYAMFLLDQKYNSMD